jgi:hypothetical protein
MSRIRVDQHRRVLPAGFDRLSTSGAEVRGAVQVRAERQAAPGVGWQMDAIDAAGHTVLVVSGLRLRDVGPLEPSVPWHPPCSRPPWRAGRPSSAWTPRSGSR